MFTAHLLSWAIQGSLVLLTGWLIARANESRSARISHCALLAVLGIGLAVARAEPTDAPALKTAQQEAAADSNSDRGAAAIETPVVIVTKDPAPRSPAISVRGTVRDLEGNPLSGTQVVLRAMVAPGHEYAAEMTHDRDVLARTQSDAEGRFSFGKIRIPPRMVHVLQNLRDGNAGAQLVVWGEGKGVAWEPISSFEPAEMEIRLAPQADVSGVVTDEFGNAQDDVELRAVGLMKGTDDLSRFADDPGDLRLLRSEIRFRTRSKDGRFSLPNMPHDVRILIHCLGQTGQTRVIVADTGHGTADRVWVRNGVAQQLWVYRTPIQVNLIPHPWVKIRVVDQNGHPVSGGGVDAVAQNGAYGGAAEVGEDGTAILTVERPGVYDVSYGSDPLAPAVGIVQEVDIKEGGSADVEMKLPASRLLIGRVIDSDSGNPVIGAYVNCRLLDDDREMPRPTHSLVVSDRDGVFQAPVTDGVWRLTIRHDIDGYFTPSFTAARGVAKPPDVIDVNIERGKVPRRVIIKVSRGLLLEGTVVDADGKPRAGLPVKAESMDEPTRKSAVVTDADGRFRLSGFSPYVETRVWTWAPDGTAEQMIAAIPDQPWEKTLTKTITLSLAPGTTLTGRVVRAGKPVPGVKVKLHKAPPQPPGQNWARFSVISEATTDEDGRYRVTGLHKGDQYQVEIAPTGNAEVRDWPYYRVGSHILEEEGRETIELPNAKLVSNNQQLSGIVVDFDGNALAGISVYASPGFASTVTDGIGRFYFTNLPDEPIEVTACLPTSYVHPITYPCTINVKMNATDIRIVLDPKLGSGIEDLDAK